MTDGFWTAEDLGGLGEQSRCGSLRASAGETVNSGVAFNQMSRKVKFASSIFKGLLHWAVFVPVAPAMLRWSTCALALRGICATTRRSQHVLMLLAVGLCSEMLFDCMVSPVAAQHQSKAGCKVVASCNGNIQRLIQGSIRRKHANSP